MYSNILNKIDTSAYFWSWTSAYLFILYAFIYWIIPLPEEILTDLKYGPHGHVTHEM